MQRRENRRSYSLQQVDDFERWESEELSHPDTPNIYNYLLNNLQEYDQGFKKKNPLEDLIFLDKIKTRSNRSCFPLRPHCQTAEVSRLSLACTKSKLGTQSFKESKNLLNHKSSSSRNRNIQNLENVNVNLPSEEKGKFSFNMAVQNVKFNKLALGCVKKRDRYKEIFGDKPKFIFMKIDKLEGKKNVKIDSASHFRAI